ncbi:hypothetical protein SCRES3_gp4 [Synechococcus phage S-CRES3]|nr:hypothetical protein SCRES3_gp4 [Synechococcus phage S-CRES3]
MRISKRRREEAMPFYREGGEAIGRLLNYHPEEEPRIWSLVAGLGLWQRWYLLAFRSIWRLENPREFQAIKDKRNTRRRSKAKQASRLEATHREAAAAAMLTPKQDLPEEP